MQLFHFSVSTEIYQVVSVFEKQKSEQHDSEVNSNEPVLIIWKTMKSYEKKYINTMLPTKTEVAKIMLTAMTRGT